MIKFKDKYFTKESILYFGINDELLRDKIFIITTVDGKDHKFYPGYNQSVWDLEREFMDLYDKEKFRDEKT